MTNLDKISLALCCWKENRGGGYAGMQSVANVIMNRVSVRDSSAYAEVYRWLQFTSMSDHQDPEYLLQPDDSDPQYLQAQDIANRADAGTLNDITLGATNYYASSMETPPSWAAEMTFTVSIAGQKFYK